MTGIWQKLAILLIMAAVLSVIPSTSLAALTVKNTSSYAGGDRWNWTIFIEADPHTLRQIECVEYHLHPTFPKPEPVCNKPETKFAYSANGWGTFTVKVTIFFRDGHTQVLKHPLVFEQKTTQGPLHVTPRNASREIEPGWWEWTIYMEGAHAELDRIRCVEYTLHPTFPNPVRVVCSRPNRFELTARGWGTFTVMIKLMLKDDSIRQMTHTLQLR